MAKKILVIDDDQEQRGLYAELFRQNGFTVYEADDGLEGLEMALAHIPGLLFTGIIMPRMDGFELIHNLRNNVATAVTPVILFSHLGREEDKQKAAKLINVNFMVKGYDNPSKILQKVKELLNPAKPKPVVPSDDEQVGRTTI